MNTLIRNLSLALVFAFGLIACGEGEDKMADKPAAAPAPADSAPAAEASSSAPIEKAEGVVYQDEIYANWPYN